MQKLKLDNKLIKVCPECDDHEYLCWSPFNDGTTDCMLCTGNWEEHELKEVMERKIKCY